MTGRSIWLFGGLILAVALVVLKRTSTTETRVRETDVLVIAIASDIETLDPPFSRFQRSNETNLNVFDQFFRYATRDTAKGYRVADVGTIEGAAIESWDWLDGQKRLALKIRRDTVFANTGRTVTADDFAFWFERAYGTDSGTLWNVETAKITKAEKTGDYEMTLHFSDPSPWFFSLFRDQSQAPIDHVAAAQHVESDDEWATRWLSKNDVGSGEFYVKSWEPGVKMVLKANSKYWAGRAFFDEVELRIVPNSTARALLLREGEVDIATDLSTNELQAMRGAPDVKVLSIPTRNQMILGFNTNTPPLDNVKVRQALSYAVPYELIHEGIFKGRGLVSAGPIPVQGRFHDSSLWPYAFDLEKARALLDEAGYPEGFELTLDIAQGQPLTEQVAVVLQDTFSQIAVKLRINPQSSAIFAEQLGTLEHQAWVRDLLWYVDDPGYTGELFFKTGAVSNWMGYSNLELDEVIRQLSVTVDPARKARLAETYQKLIITDAPVLFIAELPFEIAMREEIDGYVQLPDNLLWYYPLYRKKGDTSTDRHTERFPGE